MGACVNVNNTTLRGTKIILKPIFITSFVQEDLKFRKSKISFVFVRKNTNEVTKPILEGKERNLVPPYHNIKKNRLSSPQKKISKKLKNSFALVSIFNNYPQKIES